MFTKLEYNHIILIHFVKKIELLDKFTNKKKLENNLVLY